MEPKMLDAKYHLNIDTGYKCRYVKSDTEYFRPHNHNYYELFMVLRGEVCHIINNKEQNLKEGHLLFIRDFDIHDYKSADGNYFEFINLAFSKESFLELAEYLGTGFPANTLLKAKMPPLINLSPSKKEELFFSLTELNQNMENEVASAKMRTMLCEIFTKFFMNYSEKKTDIPFWLETTCERMKKPRNFIAGTERMYELSGKSREHLSRSMKKYYGITVSEFITGLRLEYSASLLLSSNLSATDICFECGFENVSWFYKIFANKYKTTPVKYRKKYI